MDRQQIVIYRYKLAEGVSEQAFLSQHERVSEFLKARPGFMYYSLSRTADGDWIDVNYWADRAGLDAANEAFQSDTQCRKFLAQLDASSVVVELGAILTIGQAA
jgi:hypothetical protein